MTASGGLWRPNFWCASTTSSPRRTWRPKSSPGRAIPSQDGPHPVAAPYRGPQRKKAPGRGRGLSSCCGERDGARQVVASDRRRFVVGVVDSDVAVGGDVHVQEGVASEIPREGDSQQGPVVHR